MSHSYQILQIELYERNETFHRRKEQNKNRTTTPCKVRVLINTERRVYNLKLIQLSTKLVNMEILDERADLLRLEGNQLYRAKNFNEAISKYSEVKMILFTPHHSMLINVSRNIYSRLLQSTVLVTPYGATEARHS